MIERKHIYDVIKAIVAITISTLIIKKISK